MTCIDKNDVYTSHFTGFSILSHTLNVGDKQTSTQHLVQTELVVGRVRCVSNNEDARQGQMFFTFWTTLIYIQIRRN